MNNVTECAVQGIAPQDLAIIFIWLCYGFSLGFNNILTKLSGYVHGRIGIQNGWGRFMDSLFIILGVYLFFALGIDFINCLGNNTTTL